MRSHAKRALIYADHEVASDGRQTVKRRRPHYLHMTGIDDRTATVDELKKTVQDFCEERDWDQFHDPKELAIGIVTEAAELLEPFRFQTPERCREMLADPVRGAHLRDELADVLYFTLRFAQLNGIDLTAALTVKLAEDAAHYPVDKARGCRAKYGDL